MLSVTSSQFKDDFAFHYGVLDLIERKSSPHARKWDLDACERVLRPAEFDVLVVVTFLAAWDNNGRFVDTVKHFDNDFERMDRAFQRLGFRVAAVLMPRALELEEVQTGYHQADLDVPADIAAEIERISDAAAADVSEERLTAAIVARAAEFDV